MFKICIYNKFCQIEYIYISYDIISMKENIKSQNLIGDNMDINKLVKNQKNFFKTGKTKDVNFRIESLNKLYDDIKKY